MEWQPITRNELLRHVTNLEYLFVDDQKCFWHFIRIEPEKWTEETMGMVGGGFWVVAIFGHKVLYYNDIEEGFNISPYHKYGVIDDYLPGQNLLHEIVGSLFASIKKGTYS
jgi:hypothetical protein